MEKKQFDLYFVTRNGRFHAIVFPLIVYEKIKKYKERFILPLSKIVKLVS